MKVKVHTKKNLNLENIGGNEHTEDLEIMGVKFINDANEKP